MSCKTIILRLAVDLLYVMYIGYKQMLVYSFIFDLLLIGRGWYSKFWSFLRFHALNYVHHRGSNGTLGDCTVTMPRARNAWTRDSVHSRCQRFVSCPASEDRLSNTVLGSTELPIH